MHIIAAKAVNFKEVLSDEFKARQLQIVKNARFLAGELIKRSFELVSGGTDNHLMLVDLTNKNITGKDAQLLLDDVKITVNKNGIPYDTRGPLITSGIRIGTPAVTTRGFKEREMVEIADLIQLALTDLEKNRNEIEKRVSALLSRFPIYI